MMVSSAHSKNRNGDSIRAVRWSIRLEQHVDAVCGLYHPTVNHVLPLTLTNDLYVRFFRIAERRIIGDKDVKGSPSGRGIVCFISNNSWLDGLSHPTMRSSFLTRFRGIQIDNLNGDKYRTGK